MKRNAKGKAEVIDITSWRFGCKNPDYPGVFTSVAIYSHWIASEIRKNSNDTKEFDEENGIE